MADGADEILVVDDDVDGRDALADLLRDEGYSVRTASSGSECISEVERSCPELVLLDVSMPGLDGIETMRRLRTRHRGLTVMLLTGARIDPESIGAGISVGAEEYLIKPIRPRELKARVRALLDRARARRISAALQVEQMAMLVHDLRQPLASVSLRADLLSEDGPDEETRRAGESMRGACQQMAWLINSVLTLARRAATGVTLERRRSAVEPIVSDVVEQLRPLAVQRRITLELDASGHTQADVDEFRIIQVLHNLLGNALKFTPPGGHIAVVCRATPLGLETSVSDSGPGLAQPDIDRIFERWVQTDAGRARGGTGLGLSIVKEIVEAHGGQVHCVSRPGAGARFSFLLPLVEQAVEAMGAIEPTSSTPQGMQGA